MNRALIIAILATSLAASISQAQAQQRLAYAIEERPARSYTSLDVILDPLPADCAIPASEEMECGSEG